MAKQLVSNTCIQHKIGICVTRHRQELNKCKTVRTKTIVLVSQSLRLASGSWKVNSELVTGMWLGVYLWGCSYSCMQTWLGGIGRKTKQNYLLQSFSELGKAFSSSKDAKSGFLFPASYSWGPTLRTEQETQKSKKEGRDKPIQGGKQQDQIR